MNKEDEEWLRKYLYDPESYKIYVDNDEMFVVEVTKEDPYGYNSNIHYTFTNFGYDFVVDILNFLGANIDYV